MAAFSVAPAAQTPQQPATVFRSGTELVLVNVVVRDKNGAVVRGLTRDDFSISEDDKPQTVTSFDFEELDKADAGAVAGLDSQTSVCWRRRRLARRAAVPRRGAAAGAPRSTCAAGVSSCCSST